MVLVCQFWLLPVGDVVGWVVMAGSVGVGWGVDGGELGVSVWVVDGVGSWEGVMLGEDVGVAVGVWDELGVGVGEGEGWIEGSGDPYSWGMYCSFAPYTPFVSDHPPMAKKVSFTTATPSRSRAVGINW
jgi:hypothetical protein